jgi:hypothetical protein
VLLLLLLLFLWKLWLLEFGFPTNDVLVAVVHLLDKPVLLVAGLFNPVETVDEESEADGFLVASVCGFNRGFRSIFYLIVFVIDNQIIRINYVYLILLSVQLLSCSDNNSNFITRAFHGPI